MPLANLHSMPQGLPCQTFFMSLFFFHISLLQLPECVGEHVCILQDLVQIASSLKNLLTHPRDDLNLSPLCTITQIHTSFC